MLLRTLVAAPAGPRRLRIVQAADAVNSLVLSVETWAELCSELARHPYDLVVLDGVKRWELSPERVAEIRSFPDAPDVIVLTKGLRSTGGATDEPTDGSSEGAAGRRALLADAGCVPAVLGESDSDTRFEDLLASIAARRRKEAGIQVQPVPDSDYRLGDYATASPAMREFLKYARRVAPHDTTLLLLGETGIGKGLLARSMHNEGPRAGKPFVAVNCGALNETLLESELFGHEKGAFTGADRAHRGFFEMAHTGSIFLDEIGEVPLHLQVKLLHAIEEKCVQPLGSERAVPVDVRIIAATNKNLEEEVAAKRFRRDLFYRLNVVSLTLPPLRERREDIPELAQSYVDHFRATLRTDVKGIGPEALRALSRYPWPGNLREFINAIERSMIMSMNEEIEVEDLPVVIQEFAPMVMDPEAAAAVAEPESEWLDQPWVRVRRRVLEETELRYLKGVLRETSGRIGEAAKRAGMDPRSMREKMKRFGLEKEEFR